MPSFSTQSTIRLEECDERLRTLFYEVIKHYDCSILQGSRSRAEQEEYFRTGRSKVQWPNSKHNQFPSLAVDAAPWPIDWNDTQRFYHFGGFVLGVALVLDIPLRWGGDWDMDNDLNDQTFMDLVHFEIKGPIEA